MVFNDPHLLHKVMCAVQITIEHMFIVIGVHVLFEKLSYVYYTCQRHIQKRTFQFLQITLSTAKVRDLIYRNKDW